MASGHPNLGLSRSLESTIAQDQARPRLSETRIPALTILAHSDPARVGEFKALPTFGKGRGLDLSRLEPSFCSQDGPTRPLADPHLSRQSVRLSALPDGGLRLRRGEVRTPIELDGQPVTEELTVSAEELRRGVTLVLAERVALLVHQIALPSQPAQPTYDLVGESDAVRRLRSEIRRVAPHGVSVLLRGETGTGKELVARAIHRASPRSSRPWLSVNMGALPPTLAAAELFGALRGAYTGADGKRAGYFQRADGGTLFLDEIGEAPLEVQVLLLRALESSEIQPVGATVPVKVDVRIIAATDSDLEAAIADGRFRVPLLHRLAGYEIELPNLRQRRDDIGRLLFHFLRQELEAIGQGHRLDPVGPRQWPWLPAGLVARLARYAWPGNVRQLRNAARRLVIGGLDATPTEIERLTERFLQAPTKKTVARERRNESTSSSRSSGQRRPPKPYRSPHEVGDDELVAALRANRWSLKPTAAQLRVSRASLYVLIDRCPQVRRASELEEAELEACYERHHGDLDAMADTLEVSRHGLQHRLRELAIGG